MLVHLFFSACRHGGVSTESLKSDKQRRICGGVKPEALMTDSTLLSLLLLGLVKHENLI